MALRSDTCAGTAAPTIPHFYVPTFRGACPPQREEKDAWCVANVNRIFGHVRAHHVPFSPSSRDGCRGLGLSDWDWRRGRGQSTRCDVSFECESKPPTILRLGNIATVILYVIALSNPQGAKASFHF